MVIKKTVFLSSTSRDLEEYRDKIIERISSLDGFDWDGMEKFTASTIAPDAVCKERVKGCDIFVGIIGHFRGSCPPNSTVSFTEHEYNVAKELDRPILIFIAPESFPNPANLREPDTDHQRQQSFRKKILKEYVISEFNNPDHLSAVVLAALSNWKLSEECNISLIIASGDYYVIVKGSSSVELRCIHVDSENQCLIQPNAGDWLIQTIMFIQANTSSPSAPIVYDFSSGTMPGGVGFIRSSSASYRPKLSGTIEVAEFDQPRFEEIQPKTFALRLEPARCNHLIDSSNPASQGIHLYKGIYTLWVEGDGKVDVILNSTHLLWVLQNKVVHLYLRFVKVAIISSKWMGNLSCFS